FVNTLLIVPIFLGATGVIFYFIITVHYIRVKQKVLIEKLESLQAKLGNKRVNCVELIKAFFSHNHQILALLAEIRGFNRFWTTHISNIFFSYVILICYFTYGLVFSSTLK